MNRNPAIAIWSARVKTSDGVEKTAWTARQDAQEWVDAQVVVEVQWHEHEQHADRHIAEAAGDIIGSVERFDVQDTVTLANLIPDRLLSPDYINPSDDRDVIMRD